jgi:hypothetical protein
MYSNLNKKAKECEQVRVDEKREQFLAQKEKDNMKRGPGHYYDPMKQSDFKAVNKPEYL